MKLTKVALVVSLILTMVFFSPVASDALVTWFGAALSPFKASSLNQPDDIQITRDNSTSDCPSICWDKKGNAHVMFWSDAPGNREIFYIHWNGYTWVNAQGQIWNRATYNANVSMNAGISHYGMMKLDSQANPHLLWVDNTINGHGLFYVRWNGTSWINANGTVYNGTNANVGIAGGTGSVQWKSTYLAIDNTDRPHIVFDDSISGNEEIYYIRWSGTDWVTASGAVFDNVTGANANISDTPGRSSKCSIATSPSGTPHIVWQELISQSTTVAATINYVFWNGTFWSTRQNQIHNPAYGNSKVTLPGNYAAFPRIQISKTNQVHLLWSYIPTLINPLSPNQNFDIHYVKSDNAKWVTASGQDFNPVTMNSNVTNNSGYSYTYSPTPMVLDSYGMPHIVWEDNSYKDAGYSNLDIFYIRWDGTHWVNASGQAWNPAIGNAIIVDNNLESSCADITLTDNNSPMIAWEDDSYLGVTEILYIQLKQFVLDYNFVKSVDTGEDGDFNDNGASVNAGDLISYKLDWKLNPNGYDPFESYLYDEVPRGTKYVAGTASPTDLLSYSIDGGSTWIAGEPPNGSPPGTKLRWGPIPYGWVGADPANTKYNPSASSQPDDIYVSKNSFQNDRPSIELDSKNYPHIVWSEWRTATGNYEIMYVRWDGTNWVNAAGQAYSSALNNANISQNPRNSTGPKFVLDKNDRPCITWFDLSYTNPYTEIMYVRWDGSKWVCADGSVWNPASGNANVSKSRYFSTWPHIQLDANDDPHLVWDDWSPDPVYGYHYDIFYVRWDSKTKTWHTANGFQYDGSVVNIMNRYGNVSRNPDNSGSARLALDKSGKPHITWQDYSYGDRFPVGPVCNNETMYVKWDGFNWVCANGDIYNPITGNANVSRTVIHNTGNSHPQLVLDNADRPHLGWEQLMPDLFNEEVFYVWWNGREWVNVKGEVYDPIAGNANVSNNSGRITIYLDLFLDVTQRPNIAWSDSSPGNFDVVFIRWNGFNWVSASGAVYDPLSTNSNVTRNSGHASTSAMSLDSGGFPHIVWLDDTGYGNTNSQVYYVHLYPPEYSVRFSVRVDDPFDYDALSQITNVGNYCYFYSSECDDSNLVFNPIHKPTPEFEIINIPDESYYCQNDFIDVLVRITNIGDIASTNTLFTYMLPRELEYVESSPTMNKHDGYANVSLGSVARDASIVFRIRLKLKKNIIITDELKLFTEAIVISDETKDKPAKSIAHITTKNCQERKPLLIYTKWVGIDTKTSTGESGKEITLFFKPEYWDHGTSPYTFTIDWGDGTIEKHYDKTGDKLLESKHTYQSAGIYSFWIKVDDSVARSHKVTRKLNIK